MSYTIHIAGHHAGESPADEASFEQALADKARAFVGEIEGVHGAMLVGQHVGTVDLKTPASPAEPAEPTT